MTHHRAIGIDTLGSSLRDPHATGTVGPYDGAMMMKNAFLATAFSAVLVAAGPVFAADVQRDGQLPMYPHGTLDAKEASLTPAAITHGVPLVLLTSDSVPVVDGWYSTHVPKECGRQPASGGVKFACPGGSIMIYAHDGKTQIALVPPMLGL